MNIYHLMASIKQASGHQIWEIEAESPEEALKKYKQGEGNVVHEEIEVGSLDDVRLEDIEDVTGDPE
jgi:hypothetical protein